MYFDTLIGHKSIKNTLIKSIKSKHSPDALLFHGKSGSATLALAQAYVAFLHCQNKNTSEQACGKCHNCLKSFKNTHPDQHFVFPIATSPKIKDNQVEAFLGVWRAFLKNNIYGSLSHWMAFLEIEGNKQGLISVEEIRKLTKKIAYRPYESELKSVLIWLPECMNDQAANALLKSLEEPPENTIFILVSQQIERLLPTILSRLQTIYVPNFSEEELAEFLKREKNVNASEAQTAIFLSEGNAQKALEFLENKDDSENLSVFFQDWMRNNYKTSIQALIEWSDIFDSWSKEKQKAFFDYAISFFRQVLLFTYEADLVSITEKERVFLEKFSPFIPFTSLDFVIEQLNEAYLHIERNVRAKIVMLDLSLQITTIFQK